MKNIIMCAFAFPKGHGQSMQLSQSTDNEKINIYLENAYVALVSARERNPECRVCLVTDEPLTGEWKERFSQQNIENPCVAFDDFLMPDDFVWSRAFYKLCALSGMCRKEDFSNIVLLDTDTISLSSYSDLWNECGQGVLLYEVGHVFSHPDREIIVKDFKRYYPDRTNSPVHYGGEFVAGNKQAVAEFLTACKDVYNKMKAAGFDGEKKAGDETILSIAACGNTHVLPANPYLYRFWTGEFYLTATVYEANPVCIWHLPAEKELGMRYFYRYHQKHGKFPKKEKCRKIAGLPAAKRKRDFYYWYMRIYRKIHK